MGKDYTHYSHPLRSHSRIDHAFMLRKHLPLVESVSILAVPWSDHDPVLTVCRTLLNNSQQAPWVMNDSLLSFKPILSEIKEATMEYFRLNVGSVSSPITLWEAYKSVIRGRVIRIASQRKRDRAQARRKLEQTLEDCSTAFKVSPTPANRRALDKARTDLDLCLTDEADRTLRWARQNWYSKANKPNAQLANRLQTFIPKFTPIYLHTRHNLLTGNPQRILEEFHYRLTKLYSPPKSIFNTGPE